MEVWTVNAPTAQIARMTGAIIEERDTQNRCEVGYEGEHHNEADDIAEVN